MEKYLTKYPRRKSGMFSLFAACTGRQQYKSSGTTTVTLLNNKAPDYSDDDRRYWKMNFPYNEKTYTFIFTGDAASDVWVGNWNGNYDNKIYHYRTQGGLVNTFTYTADFGRYDGLEAMRTAHAWWNTNLTVTYTETAAPTWINV